MPKSNSRQSMSHNEHICSNMNKSKHHYQHVLASTMTLITFFSIKEIWRTFTNHVDIRRGNMKPSQRDISTILSNEIWLLPRRTSLLFYQWRIIILSMEHQYHPSNKSASSYQWIINETSSSFQWSINIILSMDQHHLTNGS